MYCTVDNAFIENIHLNRNVHVRVVDDCDNDLFYVYLQTAAMTSRSIVEVSFLDITIFLKILGIHH